MVTSVAEVQVVFVERRDAGCITAIVAFEHDALQEKKAGKVSPTCLLYIKLNDAELRISQPD